jgi:hypothetical protein
VRSRKEWDAGRSGISGKKSRLTMAIVRVYKGVKYEGGWPLQPLVGECSDVSPFRSVIFVEE